MWTVIIAAIIVFFIYPFKKDCAPLKLRKSLTKGIKTTSKKFVKLPNRLSSFLFSGIKDDGIKKLAIRTSTIVLWGIIAALVIFNLDSMADWILNVLS